MKCQCGRICNCKFELKDAKKFSAQQKMFLAEVDASLQDIQALFDRMDLIITFDITPRSVR